MGLLFSACGKKEPLLIGFLGGTSGRVADLGISGRNAVQVAFTALKIQRKDQDLKDAGLSLKKFQGLQNDFRFDEFGDVERLNASVSIAQNQKFVAVD